MLPVLLVIASFSAHATHLVGGYMSYDFLDTTNNGNYIYKITLNVFRDCKQESLEFDKEIKVGIHLNDANRTLYQTVRVKLGFLKKVKPPGSAKCDYFPSKVCVEQGFYETTVVLKPNPAGYHVTWVRCCRNFQDNITDDGSNPNQGQTYYCFIPNPALKNNSPKFSGVPSPFMCAKDTNNFLNSAFDPDGDSLVYRIVHPYQGGSILTNSEPDPPLNLKLPIDVVTYRPGFDFRNPFGSGGLLSVDGSTGFTQMSAPRPGSYVVAIEVVEFRNGVELSKVRLDLQILVLDCPPNEQPHVDQPGGTTYLVEAGDSICIDFSGTDIDNDNVTIEGIGDIFTGDNGFKGTKATFPKRTANSKVNSEFCWKTDCDQVRDEPYSFSLKVTDDGCPPKFDLKNYFIQVQPFIGSKAILGPDRACANSIEYTYSAEDPSPDYSRFWWEVTNGKIVGATDRAFIRVKWGTGNTGTIRMVEVSAYGCPGDTISKTIKLVPSPNVPTITGLDTVCKGETDVTYSVNKVNGIVYNWSVTGGVIATNNGDNIRMDWPQKGDFDIKVVAVNSDGCASDTAVKAVNVRFPEPTILGPNSVCPNASRIIYNANGESTSSYSWNVTGGVFDAPSTGPQIRVNWGDVGIGTISVREVDRFGCVSDEISMNVLKDHNLKGQVPIGETEVCEYEIEEYLVYPSQGSVYDWTVSGGNQISGDSTNDINVAWGVAGNGRVGVRQRSYDPVNGTACISPFMYLDVTIFPKPTADKIRGNMDLCATKDSLTYTILGFQGSSYEWKVNGVKGNFKGQGKSSIKLPWPDAGQYTIQVQELSGDSCLGDVIDTVVFVRPIPETKPIDGPIVVCEDLINNAHYSVSGFPNSTYFWSVVNGTFLGVNTDSAVDVAWNTDNTYGYLRVVEISEYGCVGDTLELPVYINKPELEIQVVTVGLPDDRILVRWTTGADPIVGGPFILQRRNASIEGPWTDVVTTKERIWLDQGLNTDENIYEYRVITTDACGNPIVSPLHRHVQIQGTVREGTFDLDMEFTQYFGWANGVQRYELYIKENGQNTYSLVGGYDPDARFIVNGDGNSYKKCFRIKAYENDVNGEVSWSNEICFYFNPNVFVPNAFTPNGDEHNGQFRVVSSAIKNFNMQIYNRWGERVFETNDPSEGWDGTYKGVDVQSGIYMFVITFSDFQDVPYNKYGTVHVIR